MIICVYCRTGYRTFQSNCNNCGAPLDEQNMRPLPVPMKRQVTKPAAPRPAANPYARKLLLARQDFLIAAGLVLLTAMMLLFAFSSGGGMPAWVSIFFGGLTLLAAIWRASTASHRLEGL